ncbi:PAS domain S-box protein [uncultured Marivita sp.]|uniref:sensor histidine kinase n=1 Tax=uncultured Marivita sp. TaxID=888080 RepID=UPI00261055F7|nr:PAS domain S-box protein [uncultured Marivita sp.]
MDDAPIIHAFKRMQMPLMIIGPDGLILHCNRATQHLFGYGGDDLIGRPVFEVLQVASVAELNAHIKAPAVDAIIKDMSGWNRSGELIPLAVHMTAWSDAERGLQHALVLRDITDEMEAARLAKDELMRANSAIRGARIGVFEYNPVADTVIVSDVWRELLELEDEDVQKAWRDRVHPDDLETALEPVRICLEDIAERASCEYRIQSKDRSRWRWMRADISIAKRDAEGRVTRLIGAMTDITERKTTENALRKSVERFKSAFESAAVGMAVVGLDGKFLRANPALCELLEYSEEELLTTDFQTLTHPDDLNDDLNKLDLLKAGKIPGYQLEKRYIRANGATMWGLLSVGMVKDEDGRPDQFISQIVDITEQRRLDELKREFISTVSHELRTPLTSVLGSLALLSSMDAEPFSDEAQRLMFIGQENGKRLHALINDVLDFEKFSARQMRFELSRHEIAGLIEEAALANMASADKFGVRFNIDCPDRSLTGFVDPKRFQQVMTNLLTNAAKFAAEGSMIDIEVEGQPKDIRVSVANEGHGISDSFRDQIFKPFVQAAPSATRARGGTGLGLSITKKIVEQTGGTIGFDSEENGRTTFWFTVPVNEPV